MNFRNVYLSWNIISMHKRGLLKYESTFNTKEDSSKKKKATPN